MVRGTGTALLAPIVGRSALLIIVMLFTIIGYNIDCTGSVSLRLISSLVRFHPIMQSIDAGSMNEPIFLETPMATSVKDWVGAQSMYTEEEWIILYTIFTAALLIIIVGYWMGLRADDRNKPAAKQKIAELRAATAILPEFARIELSGEVAEAEALFGRKNYKRALRRAEGAMSEVSNLREVIDQTWASVAASQEKLTKAREVGLEISEEAVGLGALQRELGVTR
jgi:hypothetical protein